MSECLSSKYQFPCGENLHEVGPLISRNCCLTSAECPGPHSVSIELCTCSNTCCVKFHKHMSSVSASNVWQSCSFCGYFVFQFCVMSIVVTTSISYFGQILYEAKPYFRLNYRTIARICDSNNCLANENTH